MPELPSALNSAPLSPVPEHTQGCRVSQAYSPQVSTMVVASRNAILRLINASQHSACPCHGCRPQGNPASQLQSINQLRNFATPVNAVEKEYAFEARFHLSTHESTY